MPTTDYAALTQTNNTTGDNYASQISVDTISKVMQQLKWPGNMAVETDKNEITCDTALVDKIEEPLTDALINQLMKAPELKGIPIERIVEIAEQAAKDALANAKPQVDKSAADLMKEAMEKEIFRPISVPAINPLPSTVRHDYWYSTTNNTSQPKGSAGIGGVATNNAKAGEELKVNLGSSAATALFRTSSAIKMGDIVAVNDVQA